MGKVYSVKNDGNFKLGNTKKLNINGEEIVNNMKRVEIDLSPRLILFCLFLLGLFFYSKQLLAIVMFIFLAFVIMSTMRPVVSWLTGRKIPKTWAVGIAYLVFFILIQTVLVLVFVPFVNQLASLVAVIPKWVDDLLFYIKDITFAGYSVDINIVSEYITDFIKTFPTADNFKNVANFLSDMFGTGAFLLTSIVFSIYLVSEHDTFADVLLLRIISDEKRERVRKLVFDVERKLGSWVLGQAFVSTLSATFCGIVLYILGVPFALSLAIITGLLGVIPNVGTSLAGIIMGLVALLTEGPVSALIIVSAFVLYQPLENSVIIPKVMGDAVGLKPVVVLLGVMIFLIMFGVGGGFVAVPIMVIMKIMYEFYIDLQKLKAKGIV